MTNWELIRTLLTPEHKYWCADHGIISLQACSEHNGDSALILKDLSVYAPVAHEKVTFLIILMDALGNNNEVIKHVYRRDIRTIRELVSYDITAVFGTSPTIVAQNDEYFRLVENNLFALDAAGFVTSVRGLPISSRYNDAIQTGIIKFFNDQPTFDIRKTLVTKVATAPGIHQAVIDALCEIQRTIAFTSTLDEFRALMECKLTSAYKIASMSVGHLIDQTKNMLSVADAETIHHRATAISNRNQCAMTSMYQAMKGTDIGVLDGEKGRLNIVGSVGENLVKNINFEELFGAMDSEPCDDCNSVTSPVAYFVEILQFLRTNNLDVDPTAKNSGPPRENVLDRLFARRPDLGHLQLTCPNTTAVLPYIDLANEVMESFVVHLDEQTPGDAKNIGQAKMDAYNSDGTAGELLSEPQNTNFGAYSILATKLYPFHKLPYNQALDEARTFLKHLGTSRYELLETCNSDNGTAKEKMARVQAMVAEYLNLTHEEYSALIESNTENEHKYWGYADKDGLLSIDESTHTGLRFIKAQLLPRAGIQFSDLVDLLKTEYINPIGNFAARNTIVILHHSEGDMRYRLIRSNGDALVISDYQRIRQFIHLWHRIGWTIDEIDKAICALPSPFKPPNPAEITAEVLEQLVSILKLLKITKLEPSKLLTFWSSISMQGADSLYSRLFLTSGATRSDTVLQLDEHEYFFSLAKIAHHEPLVMATLGLTKAGLDAIRAHLPNKSDDLSMENLSFLYRYGLMAKFLGVTPTVLLEVIKLFRNPFECPTSCLEFVQDWKRMEDRGLTWAQVNYVMTGVDDPANPLVLSVQKIQEISKTLADGSAAHPKTDRPGAHMALLATDWIAQREQTKEKLGNNLVVTTFSKALGLSIPTTEALLLGLENSGKKALDIAKSFMQAGLEKISQERAVAEAKAVNGTATKAVALAKAVKDAEDAKVLFISFFPLLSRASVFISGFKLSAAEVKSVLDNTIFMSAKVDEARFAGGKLSLDGWKELVAYSQLRDSLPKGVDTTLLDLLLPTGVTTKAEAEKVPEKRAKEMVKKTAALMLTQEGMVDSLLGRFGPLGNDSSLVSLLRKLKKACDLAKRLAIDVDTLLRWTGPLLDFQHTHKIAQEIRGSICVRFTKEDWTKIVKPLQDQLRQNKRDSLIAYLLVQPKLIKWGVVDADSLFEFFMIDVQMGSCFETTRIKQAISTVQVFVQRCFCGLEERYGVKNHALDQKRWEWMKNYRMWEANRKVFLYPENWIEPSLRDDKSPAFLEFEADLVKKNLDKKSMEDAVKNYISRVDEVANLLPVAFFVEETAIENKPKTEVVHLFARTRSAPYVYYYRPYNALEKKWKPWEQVDVEIQHHDDPQAANHAGAFLIPFVIDGRLILFTPQIIKQVKKVKKDPVKVEVLETVEFFEIKLGWSEYRNGKWTPKRLSSEAIHCRSSKPLEHPTERSGGVALHLEISHSYFSASSPSTTGADIEVCFGASVGKFEFRGTSCAVTRNEGWDIKRPDEMTITTEEWNVKVETAQAKWEFNMEKGYLAAKSGSWTLSAKENNLVKSTTKILLTHESTALLTHTNAAATLHDLYTHLDTPAERTTALKIPLNELDTPFGLYDWELGLHAPMLLMDKLTSAQQYDKALEIARFVFNPMASGKQDPSRLRVWKWAPFREISARRSFKRSVWQHRRGHTDPTIFGAKLGPALEKQTACFKALLKALSALWEMVPSSGDRQRLTEFYTALGKCSNSESYSDLVETFSAMFAPDLEFPLIAGELRRLDTSVYRPFYNLAPQLKKTQVFALALLISTRCVDQESEESRMEVLHRILDPYLPETEKIKAAATELGFNLSDQDFIGNLWCDSSDMEIVEFLRDLSANTHNKQINEWRDSEFQPHVVARGRPVAYMTWMVMRYMKILIAAGDQLFRRETMESMPLAIQYYTMAAHLYGPPTIEIPKHTKTTPKTFNSLINQWDAFSNAMVTFENAFPFANSVGPDEQTNNAGFPMGYFCVPRNPEIRHIRTQIDDRLFKIRHSQDINGVTRKLALWEPPIDPAAFVRAAAAGLSLSSVMESISGPMPNYRFQYLLRGALELVQELKSLAGAFLGAKEKLDSEAFQRIRAGHESTINGMVLGMKKMSRDEANSAKESLERSRNGPLCRLNHFLQLLGEEQKTISEEYTPVSCTIEKPTGDLRLMYTEHVETTLSHVAAGLRSGATGLAGAAEFINVVPTPQEVATPMGVGLSVQIGPKNIAKGVRGAALVMDVAGQINQHLSDSAARTNMFTRQYQDRVLQANSAGLELNSINDQLKTQVFRLKIVDQDIALQEKQIETAKATEEFLRSKYSNEALYSWQETQLRTLHYETYIVAFDLAKKVEKSYQFERAGTQTNFIVGGWDDSRDGLLSAEALGLGLRRLEAAYQESRGHDFEITKHISLRQIDPKALLALRTGTSCKFSLSETLFDMDFPSHHTRRLKSVSLSLPCVVGPYTSVNCTLRLAKNSYRLGTADDITSMSDHYVPIQSVAFSSGQNDPGVFELNFHDERYLPFEGAGAISTWDLSLPEFRSFDYHTISDVILHLRYTSSVGADSTAATERVNTHLAAGKFSDSGPSDILYASFDLRNEFASTWQQLGVERPMTLSNLDKRLPWWTTKYEITVQRIQLLTTAGKQFVASDKLNKLVFQITTQQEGAKGAQTGIIIDGMMSFTIDGVIAKFGTWGLTMAEQAFSLEDLWMIVHYKADKLQT